MTLPDAVARQVVFLDGRIDTYLERARKALDAGSWEKAQAYALVARAHQHDRDYLVEQYDMRTEVVYGWEP